MQYRCNESFMDNKFNANPYKPLLKREQPVINILKDFSSIVFAWIPCVVLPNT